MSEARETRRARRLAGLGPRSRRALRRLEVALWAIALGCLGWTAWTWADARWYQASQASRLVAEDHAAAKPELPPGTPVARLSVPRLGLQVVVAEGTGEAVLRRAAGRLVGGALPGEDGNLVLAGHRDTFFRPLREIEIGDRVVVERTSGVDVYTVEWTRVVGAREVEVTRDAGYPALTLITCHPFRYIGQAPDRFVVRARRTERIG
jgi:sortase A